MRFFWTVAGDDPDWGSLERVGATGCYAPLWDTLTTKLYLRELQARVGVAGLYLGHHWLSDPCPVQVEKVNTEYRRLTRSSGEGDPALRDVRVMFNWEQKEPDDIAAGLERWRQLQPQVGTSWSPEGMQGGWMAPEFVARVTACRVRVVPQGFWGSEGRIDGAWAEDQVLRDLLRRGWQEQQVSLFYDAAALPRNWDGFAFTAGRLPL